MALSPTGFPDPVLRQTYGGQLEAAAEAFLLAAFDQATAQTFGEATGPAPTLVSAAMHILNRSAWTQPTDEQVKAAVYLGERHLGERHPDASRRAA